VGTAGHLLIGQHQERRRASARMRREEPADAHALASQRSGPGGIGDAGQVRRAVNLLERHPYRRRLGLAKSGGGESEKAGRGQKEAAAIHGRTCTLLWSVYYNKRANWSILGDMTSLSGRRLLIADSDADRAGEIALSLAALGASAETTDGVNAALDLLESAEPGFDGLLVADRLADGDGATLARAVRTSMLPAEPHLVRLDHDAAGDEFDACLRWPATAEALIAALNGRRAVAIAEGAAPDLDLAELEAIAGALTEDLLAMLRRFALLAEDLVRRIDAALAASRTEEVLALAHSLKGSAFSAGAIRLGRAARDLEAAVKDSRADPRAVDDLADATRCLAAAIGALRLPP